MHQLDILSLRFLHQVLLALFGKTLLEEKILIVEYEEFTARLSLRVYYFSKLLDGAETAQTDLILDLFK